MECGHCIFDRLRSEGMWDRFGTTVEQELEAMCDRHLQESVDLYLPSEGWPPEVMKRREELIAEQERRKK